MLCLGFLYRKRLSERKQDARNFSSEKAPKGHVGKEVGRKWEKQDKIHKEKGSP